MYILSDSVISFDIPYKNSLSTCVELFGHMSNEKKAKFSQLEIDN